ncbi:MAG: DUF4013 domain-containing protein [Planctomycetes bacterium]|nr:DUF4013 domain-containing protein [Planctomycetota bacterium]
MRFNDGKTRQAETTANDGGLEFEDLPGQLPPGHEPGDSVSRQTPFDGSQTELTNSTGTDDRSPIAVEIREFAADPLDVTEFVLPDALDWPAFPNPVRQPVQSVRWMFRSLFGIGVLIGLLAVVAAIPVLSVLVLGYLLEVEGRIARTGKLRFAFPLLPLAPRVGTIVLGIAVWLFPLFVLAGMVADAALIDPGGNAAKSWQTAKMIVSVLVAAHLCLALARGGSLGCFFRPLKNILWLRAELKNRPHRKKIRCPQCGESLEAEAAQCGLCAHVAEQCTSCGETATMAATVCSMCGRELLNANIDGETPAIAGNYWIRADAKLRKFVKGFRLKHHFLLGCKGLLGSAAILLLPTILFAAATSTQGFPVIVTVIGGVLLSIVFLYVPFLQARVAAENRLSAMFELRTIREMFTRAPIVWFIALLLVYALALPLYLFTALLPPQDVLWLVTPVFLISIYPARVITGWAYHRAERKMREKKDRCHWAFRWSSRTLMFAATATYTFFFFFARDIGKHGRLVLFEHHAFLGTSLSSLFALLP